MDSSSTEDWFPTRHTDEAMADWVARLCDNMQARWRAGRPVRVEDYTQALPDLVGDRESVLDLLAQERLLRVEAGESPELDEYLARFPAWGAEVRELFLVEERMIDLAAVENEASSRSPPGPASPAGDAPPAVPRRFEFRRWLGRGGFGRVGLYRDTKHQRAVALKFLHPERVASTNPANRNRFRREAGVAAGLNHPHVCTLHEFDLDHAPPYLVFEYVDGKTLQKLLEALEGPFSVDEAVRVARDVAAGVAHCHDHGRVHRDLKPDNIMRRADGVVKVLDLGLARSFDPTGPRITDSETAPGTIAYSSPEQLRTPREVGPPSDQFSLGVVLYELLTGHHPFEGQTAGEFVVRITSQPPTPLREHRPDLDDAIVSIVGRMLERKPAGRFASMHEVRRALDSYLEGNRQPVRRGGGWTRRRVVFAAAGLAPIAMWAGWRIARTEPPAGGAEGPPTVPPVPPPGVRPAPDLAGLLGRIAADLASADELAQPYFRYFSLAHLANDPRVSADHRQRVRDALTTLLPRLAASGNPVLLDPVGGDPTLLRVDLRHLGWTPSPGGQWEKVIRRCPYSLRYNSSDLDAGVRAAGGTIVKLLTSARVPQDPDVTPVVPADWFVSATSDDPLADTLLGSTVEGDDVRTRRDALRASPPLTRVREEYAATPVDLTRAAAELGLSDPERLRTLLLAREAVTARFGLSAWLDEGSIPRPHWLRYDLDFSPYVELAIELKLGLPRRLP